MKLIASLTLLLFLASCKLDSGLVKFDPCVNGATVAEQSTASSVHTVSSDVLAQSFQTNCKGGVISSVTVRAKTVGAGLQSKLDVSLYANQSNGSFEEMIDSTTIDNVTSTLSDYTATFDYGVELIPGKTYWIVISNPTANVSEISTSGGSSTYVNGSFFETIPEFKVPTFHRDLYFKVKVRTN